MLKCIACSQVMLGMYLHKLDGPWIGHGFWKSSFLLDREEDRQRLLTSQVQRVWIDTAKGCDEPQPAPPAPVTVKQPATPRARVPAPVEMKAEVARAVKVCAVAKRAVVSMFSDLRMGRAVEVRQVASLVEDISRSMLRHPHALLSLVRLKKANEYTYMHSVAVSGLMIALARQLNLSPELVQEAGLAGLFHDVGKMAIPEQILSKPAGLTEAEFCTVRQHPVEGAQMLRLCPQISALVLDVCLHHHEKSDGSGYPLGLAQDQISLFAQMGAVCDVYDAITSERPYKQGWGPAEAIQKMAEWKGHFDARVFQAFVRCVGIYPIGALVRLESGRIGVVVEQSPASLLTPKVKVFFSAHSGIPIPQSVLNLAEQPDKIIGRESAEEWGFKHVDELWSGLAPSKSSYFE
ncbi:MULTISPECIES: HD-GYP domain-containing protein [Pseudomonas]|uniref:HDIG domain-containing protein n=1 Tax=Pseudomonas extremorientalis TaxID=169669 RepID=A0A1H0LX12_9PSED|nr:MULTISPECIES: HD-GYP domain-containing protein [Pseudomonas]KAB0520689.1 HD-GYP domain-containing protein [Pseudomonas extremorientalis]OIN04591.1 phosphodiesterase [Pseudomonas extremorientalis]QZP19367.1 HD-GYP domain-containing protein [Pseudomonas sp. DR208]WLG54673.1 HD-GYP domain-containing protein [Pseudomonas extremorientalis]SDO72526.1 HDIG domain-containing protein [Pseudomonas extremorientalis]